MKVMMNNGARLLILLYLLFLCSLPNASRAQVTVSNCADLNIAVGRINNGLTTGEIRIAVGATINAGSCNGITSITRNITFVGLGTSPTLTGIGQVSLFILNGDGISITLRNLIISSGVNDNGGCLKMSSSNQHASITNVEFKGCSANYGGAIYSQDGSLFLNFVKFTSNKASYSGGGIDGPSRRQLLANNCIFTSNVAQSNSNDNYGGAISGYLDAIIANSSFVQNRAISILRSAYGGAINLPNNLKITNTTFTRNFASSPNNLAYGGAVFATTGSSRSIESSTFQHNYVSADRSNGKGGAIHTDYAKISSSKFLNNSISALDSVGGAIYAVQNAEISSSSFSSNKIISTGRYARGGAYGCEGYSGALSVISKSNFTLNSVFVSGATSTDYNAVDGGAVHSRGPLKENNNVFTGNNVRSNAGIKLEAFGGAISCERDLISASSSYTNNQARSNSSNAAGGAIASFANLQITSSSFTGNSAISDCKLECGSRSGGGAVYNNIGTLIKSSRFNNNFHQSFGANTIASGGALYLETSVYRGMHEIAFSNFNNNSAISSSGTARGGAVSTLTYQGLSRINNSVFTRNSVRGLTSRGGAVHVNGYPFYATNSTFTSNSAVASAGDAIAGALDLSYTGDNNDILFSSFSRNTAFSQAQGSADGGAINNGVNSTNRYGILRLAYSTFTENVARGKKGARGGSICVNDYQSILCSRCSFSRSNATATDAFGGAIYSGNYSSLFFCGDTTFDERNFVILTGKPARANKIHTGISPEVKFCPYVSFRVDVNATYNPVMKCDVCDCRQHFSPCHPAARCERFRDPSLTYCLCPPNAPGTGFSCGLGNSCTLS